MRYKKGFTQFVIVALALILLITVFLLYLVSHQNKPAQPPASTSEATNVAPKAEYQNPFDQKTQYQNPFNQYQNPFDDLK